TMSSCLMPPISIRAKPSPSPCQMACNPANMFWGVTFMWRCRGGSSSNREVGKMPNNGQAAGDRRRCPPIWLYGFAVVVILCAPFLLESGSAAGANEEADRFGILSPSQKVAAPDFTLEGPSGTPVHLRDFRGKIVFINFWATWCIPCRAEMPAIQQLY